MNNRWKDRLLSSSVPLEFEIAKILVEENFFIDYDYAYQRLDEKEEKEFSIDIQATNFYPFENPNKIELELDLLVECKFRMQDIKWAFLPSLNPYEESKISSRRVVKFIDEFSEVKFPLYSDTVEIENLSSKGIEINTQNGEVHDKGIHHGANQLIFSLPPILAHMIKRSLEDHLNDVFPYALCSILVTTAELRIFENNFSIDSVKNAASLEDISHEVPFLIFNTQPYPSLTKHCKNIFDEIFIHNSSWVERFKYYDELRAEKVITLDGINVEERNLKTFPTRNLFNSLKENDSRFFNEIVICNIKHFPELVKKIKSGVKNVGDKIERIKKL